jgi:hypothetical protein
MQNVIFKLLERKTRLVILTVGFLAACSPAITPTLIPTDETPLEVTNTSETTEEPSVTPTSTPEPTSNEGSFLEDFVFQALLPFDAIAPVYDPEFVSASDSPLIEEELVMGVSIQGEAKAYPVSVLRFREMVNDELGGLPILVTW